jgi:hypothetical protein
MNDIKQDIATVRAALDDAAGADPMDQDLWLDTVAESPMVIFNLLKERDMRADDHEGYADLRDGLLCALALLADEEERVSSMPASVLDIPEWYSVVSSTEQIEALMKELE